MSFLHSYDARTGQTLGAPIAASSQAEVDAAVQAAHAAFADWQHSDGPRRAALLEALAGQLEAQRAELVALADQETGLGAGRLNGELDRTCFQLRRFAQGVSQGSAFAFTDDPAVPGAPPQGHPAMMRVRVPLGPVAMFSASNFPFAFSVLGGDTASALAAGCPVVVKAHSGHLQLSLRVHALALQALASLGLPAGLIGLVRGAGNEIGRALVEHPLIAAGAFTGSTRGGAALLAAARQRARPIPFYGELGSINPVVATPEYLQAGGEALAQTLAASISLGCGQFCTNPGLLVFQRDPASSTFVARLQAALAAQQPHVMLTRGMREALDRGTEAQLAAGARALLHEPVDSLNPRPFLAEVDAPRFLASETLREEVFGPASLIVWTDSVAQTLEVLRAVGGSLTVTLWGVETDTPDHRRLVRGAMAIAGRVLFAGVPTGVAVTAAQQHGGPWPSSSEPMTTSVGDAALDRFLRPVALQDMPAWLTARQGQPC
ncbi:MAG: aldehyde dehydrogenase (NADP(+)) [Curvibacter sp.]|nr:aldehyde dehydrogenase (NADP(+)) [Curvibacter sp.]